MPSLRKKYRPEAVRTHLSFLSDFIKEKGAIMKFFKIFSLIVLVILLPTKMLLAQASHPVQSAENLFREGKFDEAEKQLKKIIETDSKNFDALLRLGNIALLSNRFSEAQKVLNKALELKLDDQSTMTL